MYVLERLTPQKAEAHTRRRWTRYAFCGDSAALERVMKGQRRPEDWRIVQVPGTVQATLLRDRAKPPMLMAG